MTRYHDYCWDAEGVGTREREGGRERERERDRQRETEGVKEEKGNLQKKEKNENWKSARVSSSFHTCSRADFSLHAPEAY